jgi:hypothetical protein
MGSELSKTPEGDLVIAADKLGKFRGLSSEQLHLTALLDDLVISTHAQPGQRLHPFLYGDFCMSLRYSRSLTQCKKTDR